MYITLYNFVLMLIQPQHICKWNDDELPQYGILLSVASVSQDSDILETGPYAVCFLAEARDLLSIQNIRPALGTSGRFLSGCCGSFCSVEAADA
jgi:hypothetical protein